MTVKPVYIKSPNVDSTHSLFALRMQIYVLILFLKIIYYTEKYRS